MTDDIMAKVEAKTLEWGGVWAVNHSRRLMAICARIGKGREYDQEVLSLAALSHDWGAYDPWKKAGVDHAVRAAEVLPEALGALGVSAETARRAAECAGLHHACGPDAPLEAILLHDADAIDFTGITGALRCFSTLSRDLRGAAEKARGRALYAKEHLVLPESRAAAEKVIRRAERLLEDLEEETGGLY